jgi:hypothetical protein
MIQVAKENPDYGHGIFTKHFIDGLAGAADANGDGTVSAQELYAYVHSRVIDETSQRPRKFNMDGEGVIVLRETGLEQHRDKVLVLRVLLLDLAKMKMMSRRQLTMALEVVDLEPAKMSPQDKDHFKLLENSLDGDFYPGPNNDDWNRIIAEHATPKSTPPTPPDEPELDETGGSGAAWGLSGQNKPDEIDGGSRIPPPAPTLKERYHTWRTTTWVGRIVHWAVVIYAGLVLLGTVLVELGL